MADLAGFRPRMPPNCCGAATIAPCQPSCPGAAFVQDRENPAGFALRAKPFADEAPAVMEERRHAGQTYSPGKGPRHRRHRTARHAGRGRQLLTERKIGALMVKDKAARWPASFRARSGARHRRRAAPRRWRSEVHGHMTPSVATCTESDTVEELMEMMTRGRFRHVPVLDDSSSAVRNDLDRRCGQDPHRRNRERGRSRCATISPPRLEGTRSSLDRGSGMERGHALCVSLAQSPKEPR